MTTVTILAGERTIGGTQIVVEDGGARLLFDCGLVYDPAGNPFAQVHHRPAHVLSDLLRLGLAPHVPSLYAPRWLAGLPSTAAPMLAPSEGTLAVAVSHAHLDHSHLAGFVDDAVPVYCSSATARIMEMLGALGRSLGPAGRTMDMREPGEWFTVGPMRGQLLPVDHDVCGACGLLLQTSTAVIAYSGDLRLHGHTPAHSLAFAQAARAAGATLLILEGTRLRAPAPSPPGQPAVDDDRGEDSVAPLVAHTLAGAADKLGVILLTPENGERVEALALAMQSIGRLFVLDPDGLALATAALGRPLAVPHAVYVPSTLANQFARGAAGAVLARLWAAVEAAPARVTAAEVAADAGHFLVRLDWPHMAEVLDLVPHGAGGVLFPANGAPLGSFDPAWQQLEWWAHRLDLRFVPAGSSGHATPEDLTAIVRASGVPYVMGIHSLHPEILETGGARLILPIRGRPYNVDRLAEV